MNPSIAVVIAVTAIAAFASLPLRAQTKADEENCVGDNNSSPDIRIRSCSALINSARGNHEALAAVYFFRGRAWHDKGNLDRAIADYDQSLRLDPGDVAANQNRGLAWLDKGDHERAIADFSRAIVIQPMAVLYVNRARVHDATKDFARAIADYSEAIRLDANNPSTYEYRCWSNLRADRLPEAIGDCSQALRHDPKLSRALFGRGYAHLKSGRFDQAIADFDRELADNPGSVVSKFGRGIAKTRSGDSAGGAADIAAAEKVDATVAQTVESALGVVKQQRTPARQSAPTIAAPAPAIARTDDATTVGRAPSSVAGVETPEIAPAVLEVLREHPAFKAFPAPRMTRLAMTVQASGQHVNSSTKFASGFTLRQNGIVEASGDSEYSGSGGWSTISSYRSLNFANFTVDYRSSNLTRRPNVIEDSRTRFTLLSIQNVEGGLFPMGEGRRLAFQRSVRSSGRSRVLGGEEQQPFETQITESVVMEVVRRTDASAVVPGIAGTAWEVTTTETAPPPRKPSTRSEYFVEELASFVPAAWDSAGSMKSRGVIDEIRWRDASGQERRAGGTVR